jgi:hypothetical protein
VYVVALAELHGTVDAEAPALAADLGVTAYEARLLLAAGLPAVVKTTPDRALALELLGKIRARAHGAVACDASAVIASSAMVPMTRFALRDDGVAVLDEGGAHLPYDDVLALVAAVHRLHADTTTTSRETKFSMQRTLLTGGIALTKTVMKETRTAKDERDGVLYVFRRSGATPWLLREHGTSWSGLSHVAPTEAENYRAVVAALRARAVGATFDDRLVTRKAPERTSLSGGTGNATVRSSTEAGVDLLAHLLAMWIARGAYR